MLAIFSAADLFSPAFSLSIRARNSSQGKEFLEYSSNHSASLQGYVPELFYWFCFLG